MPIFLELTPHDKTLKCMYRIENIDSFEDADVNGEDFTFIIFSRESNLENIVVKESYMDIWETLRDLKMVEEVNKDV